ncbi:MAG: phage major capsid protein [Gemmatimonadaceae bacterium]|nr:phage major capsid protein [Gemmatimonadaceae bacterium]
MKRVITSRLAAFAVLAAMFLVAAVNPAWAFSGIGFAGVTTTTASLDTLMKVIYSDPLMRDIVSDSELMDLFKTDMNVKTEETTGGRYIEMAHYLRLAGAAGARAENDYLPVPQLPRAANSRIFLKKILGVVEMTGDVMEKVVSDEGSFINYMERALPDTKQRVVNEIDRMYIGYGAAIKARVVSVVGSVITVDRALGVTGYADAWLQFSEGETLTFSSTPAGAVLKNAGTTQAALVESINETNNAITVTADAALLAAIAANDYIFAGDQSGTSSQNGGVDREISGLLAGVDNGGILATYNNIARAGNRNWNARVIDGSVAPYNGVLTEDLLMVADVATSAVSGAKIDVLVTNPHAPIGYWKALRANRVINDPRSYTGGVAGLSIMLGDRTLTFKTARKLPPQIAFGLTTSSWRRFTLGQWEWVSRGGSVWNLVTDAVGRKDAYFAFGKMYEQLACINPRQNFRIDGLLRQFNY